MKKLFTFLMLMICFSVFAQESSTNEKDALNRVMFNSVNKLFTNIKSDEERELWLSELTKIEEKTKDKELIEQVKIKKDSIAKLNLPKTSFDFQDISTLNPKENKEYEFDFDKFKGRYFVHPKNAWRTDFILDPYISYKNGKALIFLNIRYFGSNWVFHDKVKFIVNNNVIDFPISKPETKVLSAGKVKEYSSNLLSSEEIEILRQIANSEQDVDIRFESDTKASDNKINKKTRNHIKLLLDFFDKYKK